MPSEPRPKGHAKPATKAEQAAALETEPTLPRGASLGAPESGLWHQLLDADGKPVEVDGQPVRLP